MQEIDVPSEGMILKDRSGKEYIVYSSTVQNGIVIKTKRGMGVAVVDNGLWITELGYSVNTNKLFFGDIGG